jgi:hypothetical protein
LGGLDEVFAQAFKNTIFLRKYERGDQLVVQLEDNQAGLQTMLASRFVAGIRDQVMQ